ncbi:aminotransferase class III-fold pyridoxal phosphate-dependent enzyme [Akkermansiaceae bacterium]|nr:aminotransferase class III-fold pyridoxal phosphate-dependent enzyme [Akkermansiaceae bacterium]MDB4580582.1 aminotransferase class III-fold pyridoxal phosphate-dependent enzyme [Akkermansiaceae bacterium]MDB4684350.1 aminotransferase class III-fold pyridoxal phosphate-dependent enzyme [Akkermansiaceae bacterium]
MKKGQLLYNKAKTLIPGGTMLLSKRPEMHLPDQWPSYFQSAKGITVTDLDGQKYTDMYIMGIGTNTLGYGYAAVDAAVTETIKKGNMSTLSCPEEVGLAEKLVELHPWSDMVRLARSGGEANSIAVRIARAASGRDKVAICGYHGWHDWYISTNLGDNAGLDEHLLPGLKPAGVPRILAGTTIPFEYNNLDQISQIVKDNPDLGVIKMEVTRNMGPIEGYLEGIRKLCDANNIVLIFDECTSGFRETYGGIHLKYGVEPDVCMFGKALGNGYAITAVLGRKEVMEAAQKTFISSTFWTERIGPAAAVATLEAMKETRSWDIITEQGKKIQAGWQKLGEEHNLRLKCAGIPALSTYSIESPNWLKYKTFITQEMLKRDYLAGSSVYLCIEHTDSVIDNYLNELNPIMKVIRSYEETGRDIGELLEGPVCHSSFKRLN